MARASFVTQCIHNSGMRRLFLGRALLVVFWGGLFCGILWLQACLRGEVIRRESGYVAPPEARRFKVDPVIATTLAFGHTPILTDLLWVRALVDERLDWVLPGQHAQAFYDLDLATDLDGAFFNAYLVGSLLIYVVRSDADGAWRLLQKGETFRTTKLHEYGPKFESRFWTGSWWLPMLLGYLAFIERGDLIAGRSFYEKAAVMPGAPPYLKRLISRLERSSGRAEIAIRLTQMMFDTTKDEVALQRLHSRLRDLRVYFFLAEAQESFVHALGADRLKILIGSRDPRAELNRAWNGFVRSHSRFRQDPLGGKIEFDRRGQLFSSSVQAPIDGILSPIAESLMLLEKGAK